MKPVHDYYSAKGRVILHVDMNAFYCSVHEAVEPDRYQGKPLAVAGSVELRKGIIVTSSYAARRRGISTGMQVGKALKLCPDLILLQPDFHLYRHFSKAFMKIIYNYSPMLEATSIDECYVDISGSRQFGNPVEIAQKIQDRIMQELGLPCSIGIAPNKLLAKMASDMKKPNGITVLRIRDVPYVLWDKPCSHLFGIGAKTGEKLNKLRIHNLGDLAKADEALLSREFGVLGHWLKRAANGLDDGVVNPDREQSKSIGHTTTLPANVTESADVHRVFLNLADQTARRLRKQQLVTQTIQITIRNPDMHTITRSSTLETPTEDADMIYKEACKLYAKHWKDRKPIRLLGITLQNLIAKTESAIQLDLFDYVESPKKEILNQTLDKLRDKFGESAVLTAGMLSDDPSALIRNHRVRGTSLQMDHLRSGQDEEQGE
ncbi:DNA polymerase IV [Paenibacillus swuensis]|uniref:DNA polymerase IV n=1 Tax=Paenibacillus swuensis TaxID=1178515 RepID=A0A172TNF8_9BACL|nr:DNA polymerase IV [Paenibacillus swuensis]ANE48283.1 DNA polymerase IV [Paenibacillus swuensis]